MLPRSIPGVLGDSGGLCGPPCVKEWGHGVVMAAPALGIRTLLNIFGPHTPLIKYAPNTPRAVGGVLLRAGEGGRALRVIK
jgi:hypothetical protein